MSRTRLGVVMDPIAEITPAKDSTLAMLLAAQARDWELHYFEQSNLRMVNGQAIGDSRQLVVRDDAADWFELAAPETLPLGGLDLILMRKDPPFDMEFIYTTYILERAKEQGALVVNEPAALRDINEKAFTAWFPQCCPDTLITRSISQMRSFLKDHGEMVVKPLDGMGGRSIFVVRHGDNNANVIFETLTQDGQAFAIAQRYIPEITAGDKRILLVNGEPAGVCLARIPPPDDNRGNLVMGAQPEVRPLSDRDRSICSEVGPILRERGVIFAGLDVIGDYLTEINVTSPTGIREIARLGDEDMAAKLMDALNAQLAGR
ncbi:MAG: glutathione synthase [Gammaproteobacteria bacterium]